MKNRMTVTQIEAVTKTRYKVYLDGQFAFVLYKGELSRYHIVVGENLTEDVYQQVLKDVILKRAKLRAMHLLNSMGRTESQLREKLKQNFYPEEVVEAAMDYVKSFGYINDEEYARSFIDSRKERKSKREMYMQLGQKGIAKDVLDRIFEEYYDSEDSKEAIAAILRKRRYDPEKATNADTQKVMGYLMRKGFTYDDIRKVLHVSEWNA